MKKIFSLFPFYNLLLITSLVIASIRTGNATATLPFTFLFVLVGLYFALVVIKKTPGIKHAVNKKRYRVMERLLAIYSFGFITILFFALMNNMSSTLEIVFIAVLLPLELYFIFLTGNSMTKLTRKNKQLEFPTINAETSRTKNQKEQVTLVEEHIKEKDRRAFLKLIAGAGFGVLLTVLINPQKAGAAFFGSVPGPGVIGIKDSGGTLIDPSIKSPTDGYGIMNTDTASAPYYYGFVNKDGAWYIIKEVGDGSFLYAKGNSGYNWSNRASETYASYNTTF